METSRLCEEACTSPAFTLLSNPHETTDEALELIAIHYQQALALMNLEDLFTEGQLDCI
jgi:hypothetical protein